MGLAFNGTNQSASSTADVDMSNQGSTGALTISFWARSPTFTAGQFIEQSSAPGAVDGTFQVGINGDGDLRFGTNCRNGTPYYSTWDVPNAELTDAVWTHYLFRIDKDLTTAEAKAWMNGASAGAQDSSYDADSDTVFTSEPIFFGARGNSSFYTEIDIAEVAIYDSDLGIVGAAQLATCAPILVSPEKLRYYWPMLNGSGKEVVSGVNLTTNSGTATEHPPVFYPSSNILSLAAAAGVGGFEPQWAYGSNHIIYGGTL